MDYINQNTGTLTGPLQIQSKGPWMKGGNGYVEFLQYDEDHLASVINDGIANTAPLNIRINCHPVTTDEEGKILLGDPHSIPNKKWVSDFVGKISGGGELSPDNFVLKADFDNLNNQVQEISKTINKANLTKLAEDVKILLDYKKELEEVWVIDGGYPDGSLRDLGMI